jgi:uncharacterized protein
MKDNEPASPCNRSCTLDPATDICVGCLRTLQEILGWSAYTVEEKLAVLKQIEVRRAQRPRSFG